MKGIKDRINLVELPAAVPQRGNRFTRLFGQIYTADIGWHYAGTFPDLSKFVIVLAPHTSNMDFAMGLAPLFALGLRISFMAKSTLFWEPLGTYLRWLGAAPIDRKGVGGYVQAATREFNEQDKFVLAITPEGTRSKVNRWKTGFYHIARGANVPILPVVFDYSQREFRFEKLLWPSDDMDEDIKKLMSFYNAKQARLPENF